MSRDDGFPVADMDSAYFDDAKMRDLWQRVRDGDRMARAVVLHSATLLASWRQGERVTVAQASPLWMTHDDETVADLQAVKLLDRGGKIPIGPWNKWFGPAYHRREAAREKGRRGGVASGKSRSTTGEAEVQHGFSTGEAQLNPSVPTVRPSVRSSLQTGPSTRAARKKNDGLSTPPTKEEALLALSEDYKAGRLTELEYSRQRKALGAA